MDKESLSHYGWLIIALLLLGLILNFTTPLVDYAIDAIRQIPRLVAEDLGECFHDETRVDIKYRSISKYEHRLIEETRCVACGKLLSTRETDTTEPHEWNEDYKCVKCGYFHIHDYAIIHRTVYEIIEGNDWLHSKTMDRECECGSQITVTGRDPHVFVDDKCQLCGYIIEDYGKHTHVFDQKVVDDIYLVAAPTCTTEGTYYKSCVCREASDTLTFTVPALGHDFAQWQNESALVHKHKCLRCGITETAEHEWNAGTSSSATCTTGGEAKFTCAVCGATKTEYVDSLGHDYRRISVSKECDSCGGKIFGSYKKCSRCGATTGTTWNNHTCPKTECDHSGGTAYCNAQAVCEKCGCEYGGLDPNNHRGGTYIADALPATCTSAGYTGNIYCAGCGRKIDTGSIIPMLDHTWGAWQNADGERHRHACVVCGTEEYKPHNWTLVSTSPEPTCTTSGKANYKCSDCNATKTEALPPLGHLFPELRYISYPSQPAYDGLLKDDFGGTPTLEQLNAKLNSTEKLERLPSWIGEVDELTVWGPITLSCQRKGCDYAKKGFICVGYTDSIYQEEFIPLYVLKTYWITYDANGGKKAPDKQAKTEGVNITITDKEPTRADEIKDEHTAFRYTFGRWSTQADGKGTTYYPGGTYAVDADITLYAMWDVIIYDPNPSTPTEPEPTEPDDPDSDDCRMGIHHYEIKYECYDNDTHKVIHDCVYCNWGDYYKLEDHSFYSGSFVTTYTCPECGNYGDMYFIYCRYCSMDSLDGSGHEFGYHFQCNTPGCYYMYDDRPSS